RITIEECWWTDPRRSALIGVLGSEKAADWCAMRAWRLAQEFWKRGRGLVPKKLFDTLEGSQALLGACLAELRGDDVYICGSSSYLDWINEQKQKASKGGEKS